MNQVTLQTPETARQFRHRIAELLGTYTTCQAEQLGSKQVDLDVAIRHVQSCQWCTQHLYSLEEVRNARRR